MTAPNNSIYLEFNFLVSLGDNELRMPFGGFQECSGLDLDPTDGFTDDNCVVLKRGVVQSGPFRRWLEGYEHAQTAVIQIQNEDRTQSSVRWKLTRARIIKHLSGPFNATGTDVAMEELVLSHERLEID